MNYLNTSFPIRIKIAIADDHILFAKSLSSLINTFPDHEVIIEAFNGEDLLCKLEKAIEQPDILILDMNMPVMGGVETAKCITEKYPMIKVIALTMQDDDSDIIKMIRAGCCSYLLKGIYPEELKKALQEVYQTGMYNADAYNVNHRRLRAVEKELKEIKLTENELRFLRLACSENSYREIGAQMNYSYRTVDGFRAKIFEKFKVNTRMGMILEGMRLGFIDIAEVT